MSFVSLAFIFRLSLLTKCALACLLGTNTIAVSTAAVSVNWACPSDWFHHLGCDNLSPGWQSCRCCVPAVCGKWASPSGSSLSLNSLIWSAPTCLLDFNTTDSHLCYHCRWEVVSVPMTPSGWVCSSGVGWCVFQVSNTLLLCPLSLGSGLWALPSSSFHRVGSGHLCSANFSSMSQSCRCCLYCYLWEVGCDPLALSLDLGILNGGISMCLLGASAIVITVMAVTGKWVLPIQIFPCGWFHLPGVPKLWIPSLSLSLEVGSTLCLFLLGWVRLLGMWQHVLWAPTPWLLPLSCH